MGKSTGLYKHAKQIIPGGTQLLSKRPEQFLPGTWPSYYSKAKGYNVWDLDDNKYADVCYMGIGACVLGYANDAVDSAVNSAIAKGGMCTLNAPEEVYLADKLLALHGWADMVRYAKAGGEAMAQAVRIARAATGKDKILFCGYHGWQDWYLAANLNQSDSLKAHLLPGLAPAGVPRGLKGTMLAFKYNDIEEFKAQCIAGGDDIAAVVMEPVRNDMPQAGFLEEIREYTSKNGIALIFDEITSGFRINCGGSHLVLNIEPDIAVFGKALANGFPISAIVGKKEVMSAAQDTFISSTFWTERTGFAAALAAIDFYEKNAVHKQMIHIGNAVQKGWADAAKTAGLGIHIGGIAPLSHFALDGENPLVTKTFFTQEMLKRGYLASTAFYTCFAHDDALVERYIADCAEVFAVIAKADDLEKLLDGEVCHGGFKRLN